MPSPVAALLATDNELVSYLVRLERRVTELERRAVGLGTTITIGGFTISASGTRLVATRLSDGVTRTIADFA